MSRRASITVDSHADHQRTVNHLAQTGRPAVVIAGGGMCSGGRIVNYLKAMLGDTRHNVVFVGYQARGTPGAQIQQFGPRGGYVELDGERYEIKAGIHSLGGYSAHADQQGLVRFITGMRKWPGEIRLIHGEAGAKEQLQRMLEDEYQRKGDEALLPSTTQLPGLRSSHDSSDARRICPSAMIKRSNS